VAVEVAVARKARRHRSAVALPGSARQADLDELAAALAGLVASYAERAGRAARTAAVLEEALRLTADAARDEARRPRPSPLSGRHSPKAAARPWWWSPSVMPSPGCSRRSPRSRRTSPPRGPPLRPPGRMATPEGTTCGRTRLPAGRRATSSRRSAASVAWAGDPSFRAMAARSGQRVAASTLCAALGKDELPRQEVVLAVIAGCGGQEEDVRRYATAWRRIRSGNFTEEAQGGTPLRAVRDTAAG
jgi:hypothetical protein